MSVGHSRCCGSNRTWEPPVGLCPIHRPSSTSPLTAYSTPSPRMRRRKPHKTTHPPVLSGRNMKMQLAQLFQVALQTFRQETGVAGYGMKPRIRLKVQITTQHASSNLTMTCIRFFHSQQHACIHACIHKRTCMHTNVHTHSNKNMYMYIDQYQHPTPVPMPIPRHEQISMHFPIDLQRNIHLHECSRTNTHTHV